MHIQSGVICNLCNIAPHLSAMSSTDFPVYTQLSQPPLTHFTAVRHSVFEYPFFNEGVAALRQPGEQNVPYTLDQFPGVDEARALELRGFIFHTAHCGSTLLARMLGKLPGVRIVSETEAINGLLLSALFFQLPEQEVLQHLQKIIDAYRQPGAEDRFLIFKMSSWNVFLIGLFQRLYPQTPWLYLDRETETVVQSLLKSGRGFTEWWHHPNDMLRRHFTGPDFVAADFEAYLRRMVEQHRHHAQAAQNEQGLFLEYPAFIDTFQSRILPHFQLQYTESELSPALELTRFEAKTYTPVPFQGTAAEKA